MSAFDRIVQPLRDEQSLARKERLRLGTYVIGKSSRFALTRHEGDRVFRFPWQRPRGGWCFGRYIVWWSK